MKPPYHMNAPTLYSDFWWNLDTVPRSRNQAGRSPSKARKFKPRTIKILPLAANKTNMENQNKSETPVEQKRLVRMSEYHEYNVSRDYNLLYELAQTKCVVCIVDFQGCRDVAATLVRRNDYGSETDISARGICYVASVNIDEFLMQCKRLNVEFINPNAKEHERHE